MQPRNRLAVGRPLPCTVGGIELGVFLPSHECLRRDTHGARSRNPPKRPARAARHPDPGAAETARRRHRQGVDEKRLRGRHTPCGASCRARFARRWAWPFRTRARTENAATRSKPDSRLSRPLLVWDSSLGLLSVPLGYRARQSTPVCRSRSIASLSQHLPVRPKLIIISSCGMRSDRPNASSNFSILR